MEKISARPLARPRSVRHIALASLYPVVDAEVAS